MADLQERIKAHALANAVKYEGKANPNNVLPKIIGEFPDEKKDIPALRLKIDAVVSEVNTLTPEEQHAQLETIAPELLEKKERKERELPPLPNAIDGNVVTRIPPEPSKYNHLGHALSFLINYIYAQRYHGHAVLRFEDTNPEKENQEFVDTMMEDITGYLGIMPAKVRFVSDDMELLYNYARQLIEKNGAFMCFCDRDTMSKNREEMKECDCRNAPLSTQLTHWEDFKSGKYIRGEAILRFRGDMRSQNTVMRDPVLFRAVPTPHFRQGTKYKIWPVYDFYNPIEDVLCGITHILRSNEFELRIEVHQHIKRLLGLADQHVLQYGRIGITGATTQGREIRALIESGEYIGWDDPRLVTLRTLKRRGIKREAYYELIKTLGLSPYPVSLDFSMLAAANRKFIENSNRYSFVADPQDITVHNAHPKDVELDLHPERKGGRPISVHSKVFVSGDDIPQMLGKRTRLMGLCTISESNGSFDLLTYEQVKKGHDLIVNWVSGTEGEYVQAQVMMPDATIKTGFAEKNIATLQVDDIIQFERFGFCRLDAVENDVWKFWYTHK